jgi:putative nucleotidyltransferase with HDIG domain
MIDLKTIVAQIDTLTPVPQVVNQVMELADKPNSSLAEVADIIKYDPVITANMLKICNSAYFGMPRTIDSIHDATMLLGLDQIVELFIFRCAFDNLNKAQDGYALRENELLKHAVASAMVAKTIAVQLKSPNQHLVFTAALLKDIGKLVISRYLAECMDQINESIRERKLSFIAAEKRVLGFDHAEIGGLIAEQWGFSARLTDIIRNHHLVEMDAEGNQDTLIVCLSDNICMLMGHGTGVDGLAYADEGGCLEGLHLPEDTINAFKMAYVQTRPKVDALISLS